MRCLIGTSILFPLSSQPTNWRPAFSSIGTKLGLTYLKRKRFWSLQIIKWFRYNGHVNNRFNNYKSWQTSYLWRWRSSTCGGLPYLIFAFRSKLDGAIRIVIRPKYITSRSSIMTCVILQHAKQYQSVSNYKMF
jgi:hypothetical protein